jgi:DNA-binding GntR family transcriptional regulator
MEDPRLYRRIAAGVADRIATGDLAPGDRLNVGLLADEWDTTRITVGKALRLLGEQGALVLFPGLGWYVNDPQNPL